MAYKIITQAEGHVLTLAELRRQCEVVPYESDSDGELTHPDDDLLLGYLDAAVEHAENFMGRAVALRTYEIALNAFPCGADAIELPMPPLVELVSFTSADDSDGAIDAATYVLDDYYVVPRIVPLAAWPYMTASPNAVKVRFRAGYSSTDSDAQPLPHAIKQALLLTVADWYQNREDNVEGSVMPLPNGAMALMRPLRVRLGMS